MLYKLISHNRVYENPITKVHKSKLISLYKRANKLISASNKLKQTVVDFSNIIKHLMYVSSLKKTLVNI